MVIVFKNNYKDKEVIFKSLLLENNDNLSDINKIKEKYKKYSIDFEFLDNDEIDNKEIIFNIFDYNKNENNNNLNREKEVFKKQIDSKKEQLDKNRKNILHIIILLYYYEDYLSKKNFVFNEDQTYYLINYEWIKWYKKLYYFNDIYDLLKKYDLNNKGNSFLNIDKNINSLIDMFYDEYINLKIKIGLNENLKDIPKLKADLYNKNNLKYYNNCYIIPSKIIDKIIKIEFNCLNTLYLPNKIKSKNEKIFLYFDHSKYINLGFLNENLLFQSGCIFSYNSSKQYEYEKKVLLNLSINDYIHQKNCNENSNEVQIMKNNNNNIGKLLILNENIFIPKSSKINHLNEITIRNIYKVNIKQRNREKQYLSKTASKSTLISVDKNQNKILNKKSLPKSSKKKS